MRGCLPCFLMDKAMINIFQRILLGLCLLTFFCPQSGFTQSSEELKALRKEIEALKEGQRAIQKELQEIRNILQGKQLPQEVVLNVADNPFKGDKNAKLALIEFSDYQ